MRVQCLLLVFLALNGVTEAYTFAAMNHKQLHWSLLEFLFPLNGISSLSLCPIIEYSFLSYNICITFVAN
jgi:hypothetical protein